MHDTKLWSWYVKPRETVLKFQKYREHVCVFLLQDDPDTTQVIESSPINIRTYRILY